MNTDKGYIKVYRNIRDHWLWEDKPFSKGQAWIDLLMIVNHEDKKMMFDNEIVICKRGMTVTSLRKLSTRWGWSPGKVDRFLKILKSEIMIREERNTRRTAISIVNYGDYQQSADTKRNSHGTLTEQSRNTHGNKQYTKEDTIEDTKKKKEAPFGAEQDEEGEPWDEEGWE